MKIRNLLIGLMLCSIAFNSYSQHASLKSLLPDPSTWPGWDYSRAPEYYEGDELFELIDGGADLFHEYQFVKVVNTQYAENNGSKIQLEIYEMNSDSSAYGIFSSIYNTPEVSAEIGLYSVVNEQYVAFVKGRYYVNIAWVLRKEARQESLTNLAAMVESRIPEPGQKPYLIRQLCKEKCAGIPIYFRGNVALSNVYYFDFKDHFQIDQGVAIKDPRFIKMVFVYEKEDKAQKVFTSVRDFIETSKRFRDPGMIYQGFSCSDNKGNKLIFRLGTSFITVLVALKPDVQLMAEQEALFHMVENALKAN